VTSVLAALTHRHEAEFVRAVEAASELDLVRRCADVAELLSAGAAGAARVAVVSPDLRGLDRDALRHLAGHGVRVAGLVGPGDDEGERRLRQLGVLTILGPGDGPDVVAAALTGLAGDGGRGSTAGQGGFEGSTGGLPGVGADGASRFRAREGDDGDDGDGLDVAPEVPTPVTVVWGPTGAPGRSTVAVSLAAHLAAGGVRTLIVDLDTWGASIAQMLGLIDEAPGVAAAARASEQGSLDVVGLARMAPEVLPGLRVLTGLPKAERWPELRSAAVEDVLRLARLVVDHVVVDVGFAVEDDEELSYDTAAPRRNATTLTALEQADHLVAVGAADPVGLQRLVRAVQDVAVLPSPRPVIVVNKVRASVAGPRPERSIADVLGRFAGMESVRFLPWAPDDCDAALLAGRALPEVAPQGALTLALAQLAARLEPRMPSAARAPGRRRARKRRLFGQPSPA
jgi:MinD-like ATPase involved in chromosome partitioning or flagellar assembly